MNVCTCKIKFVSFYMLYFPLIEWTSSTRTTSGVTQLRALPFALPIKILINNNEFLRMGIETTNVAFIVTRLCHWMASYLYQNKINCFQIDNHTIYKMNIEQNSISLK